MNRQQIYDRVKRHLLKQGVKSIENVSYTYDDPNEDYIEPECRYRTTDKDGHVLKCAIGCLIPLRNYDPAFEGDNARGITERGDVFPPSLGITWEDTDFLNDLQLLHDGNDPAEWPDALERFSRRYNLTA